MANVSFDEETYQASQNLPAKRNGLLGAVVRMGFAKDEKGASACLLWTASAGCVLAAGLFAWTFMNQSQGLDKNDIERIIQLQQQ